MDFRWKTNGNPYMDFWIADVNSHFKEKNCFKLIFVRIFSTLRRRVGYAAQTFFSDKAEEVISVYNSKAFQKV